MRVTIQRVNNANCVTNGKVVSEIKKGLMLLVSFTHTDSIENVNKMAKKIANLRIFNDQEDKMNLSIIDVKGEILSISQFTLYGDALKGNRPSFVQSMEKNKANDLYLAFNNILNSEYHIPTFGGSFGEHMVLNVSCDGPVTINLEL